MGLFLSNEFLKMCKYRMHALRFTSDTPHHLIPTTPPNSNPIFALY